jgi:flavin-dependent dehydrogenase
LSSTFLSSSSEYDAIIIGAGHNGLTCACYLIKDGLKVLVAEQYHSLGSMTITQEVTLLETLERIQKYTDVQEIKGEYSGSAASSGAAHERRERDHG